MRLAGRDECTTCSSPTCRAKLETIFAAPAARGTRPTCESKLSRLDCTPTRITSWCAGGGRFLGAQQDTLLNPTLVIEVLSPSTEAYDRGIKFELYRTIESLREYVLISSERILVERFLRHTTEEWLLTAVNRMEGSIHLDSIGLDLRLADLYEKVEFAPTGPMIRPLHAG